MPRTDATARASRKRKPRRPGDTDRVRALVAARSWSEMPRFGRSQLEQWRVHDDAIRAASRHDAPTTGGDYRTAAIQPDTSPLPRVTWPVPADACRALHGAFGEDDMWRMRPPINMRNDAAALHRIVFAQGVETTSHQLARALHLAPLPDWLAAQLWQRCPRADGRMWRWTDVLSADDAVRLEGREKCDCLQWTRRRSGYYRSPQRYMSHDGDYPPYRLYVGQSTRRGNAEMGLTKLRGCTRCDEYGTVRGIPVGSRLVRLAPGSAGRMLALVVCVCMRCDGHRVTPRTLSTAGGFVSVAPRECRACAGTGTVPLATIRDASDARERGE